MRLLLKVWLSLMLFGGLVACGATAPTASPTVPSAETIPTVTPMTSDEPAVTPTGIDDLATTPTTVAELEKTDTAILTDTEALTPSATSDLTYYWPAVLPRGLEVLPFASYADERGFMLTLQNPQDRQYFMQVMGGQATTFFDDLPPSALDVEIRGQDGYEFSTGGGWSFHWQENDIGYSVGGIMDRTDTLSVTEGLEAISFATFLERLGTVPPPVTQAAGKDKDARALTTNITDSAVPAATITALSSSPPIPLPVRSVQASSTLPSEDLTALGLGVVNYNADLMLDTRPDTAWVEGKPGPGAGEVLTFAFERPVIVVRMSISAGLERDEDIFRKNNRPRTLTISYADGTSETVRLADRRGFQEIALGYKLTDSVKLTLGEVYPGTRYDDTPITEVRFTGYEVE